MLDLLCLPTILSHPSSSSMTTTVMATETEDKEPQSLTHKLTIVSAWQQVQSFLSYFFDQIGDCRYGLITSRYLKPYGLDSSEHLVKSSIVVTVNREHEEKEKEMVVDVLSSKLHQTMTQLLEATRREEIVTIFEHVLQQVCMHCKQYEWTGPLDGSLGCNVL